MDNTELKSRIEAVLFVTGRAVTIEEIANILETEPQETEEAMLDLIYDYSSRDGALESDDENGYIIQVKEEFSDITNKLCPVDISAAVLKTTPKFLEYFKIKGNAEILSKMDNDRLSELLELKK